MNADISKRDSWIQTKPVSPFQQLPLTTTNLINSFIKETEQWDKCSTSLSLQTRAGN